MPWISNGYPWICRLPQSTLKTVSKIQDCPRTPAVPVYHQPITQKTKKQQDKRHTTHTRTNLHQTKQNDVQKANPAKTHTHTDQIKTKEAKQNTHTHQTKTKQHTESRPSQNTHTDQIKTKEAKQNTHTHTQPKQRKQRKQSKTHTHTHTPNQNNQTDISKYKLTMEMTKAGSTASGSHARLSQKSTLKDCSLSQQGKRGWSEKHSQPPGCQCH